MLQLLAQRRASFVNKRSTKTQRPDICPHRSAPPPSDRRIARGILQFLVPSTKHTEILTMPRLVRQKPWAERVQAMLNPMDFLLWLSEELETRDWDSKALGTQLGLGFNFVFLLARANSAASTASDDVFSDGGSSNITIYVVSCDGLPLRIYSLLTGSQGSPSHLDTCRSFRRERLLHDDTIEALPTFRGQR